MFRPSLKLFLSVCFLAYIGHSMWSLSELFQAPSCSPTQTGGKKKCLKSILNDAPPMQLLLASSFAQSPKTRNDLNLLVHEEVYQYDESGARDLEITIPTTVSTKVNSTIYMHAFLSPRKGPVSQKKAKDVRIWDAALNDPEVTYAQVLLTSWLDFNDNGIITDKKCLNVKSSVYLSLVTENFSVTVGHESNVPPDLAPHIRLSRPQGKQESQILPFLFFDGLKEQHSHYVPVLAGTPKVNITINMSPVTLGRYRLWMQLDAALKMLSTMGFSAHDIDELKSVFSGTSPVLLVTTFAVAAIHLLLDVLSLASDVSWWRKRRTSVGVSAGSIAWRAVSHAIIFLFLADQGSSMLVLLPAAGAVAVEVWKICLCHNFQLYWVPVFTLGPLTVSLPWGRRSREFTKEEKLTQELDSACRRSVIMYFGIPLLIGGAIYSVLYIPRKSWYSWILESLATNVYALGFVLMLPQVALNHKLKTVAHMPWQAFAYKAFNTVIDDLFAFIITMPTVHRVACFRDDVVFLIYLSQRWMYPVDPNRIDDTSGQEFAADTNKDGVAKRKKD